MPFIDQNFEKYKNDGGLDIKWDIEIHIPPENSY